MTIRIFIGCPPNGEDAEAQGVLEYSLRYFASEPIDITWMKLSNKRGPFHGWNTVNFSTPFTPFRWIIPELCGFKGKAIYMDCDIICMSDIAKLWNQDMQGKAILVQNKDMKFPIRTCVAMWDCEKAKELDLPSIEILKRNRDPHLRCNWRLANNLDKVGNFEGKWNCIDLKGSGLDDPDLKMIHCSSIAHQPHQTFAVYRLAKGPIRHWYDGLSFPHWRPELTSLFGDLLCEAIKAGFGPSKYEPNLDEIVQYKVMTYKNRRVKGFA